MKTFRAPWGRTLVWVSVLVSVLLLAILLRGSFGPHGRVTLLLAGLWLVLPLSALFTIRGYTVTPEAILVHRLFWDTRLPRRGLVSATVEPRALKGSMRTCGNGGLYSFTGWYWSRKLGHFHPYVTDLNRTVVLRWEKRTVVVSPDDPEGFVRAVTG
ncbi:MAG: PH domain-containing protein [Chthoniobacteraceae bacterium]|nr:PH domain-containing protein [Chthoniobacteraceae bacterium]